MIYKNESLKNEKERISLEVTKNIIEKVYNVIKEEKNKFYEIRFDNIEGKKINKITENIRDEERQLLFQFNEEDILKKILNGNTKIEEVPLAITDFRLSNLYIKINRSKRLDEKMEKEKLQINDYYFRYNKLDKQILTILGTYKNIIGDIKDYYYNKPLKELIKHCKNNNISLYYTKDYYRNKDYDKIDIKEKLDERVFEKLNKYFRNDIKDFYIYSVVYNIQNKVKHYLYAINKKLNEIRTSKKILDDLEIKVFDIEKTHKIIKAFLDYINKKLKLVEYNGD